MYRNNEQHSYCSIDSNNFLVCRCNRKYSPCKHLPIRCSCGNKITETETKIPHNKFQSTKGVYGFISLCYMDIGGTETWHKSLLPRLNNVSGFVVMDEGMMRGDTSTLNCPVDTGIEAAKQLAKKSKVLVVWSVGDALYEIVKDTDCKVISVVHFDSTSLWSRDNLQLQANKTDIVVTVCDSAKNIVPKNIPYVHIPNAPDPLRLKVTESISKSSNKVALTCSRISSEKKIDFLVDLFINNLPEWELWVVGKRNDTNEYQIPNHPKIKVFPATFFPGNYYAAADLYISASEYEGYGLSSAEALLAGLPVVSTPVGLFETKPHLATMVPLGSSHEVWVKAVNTATVKPIDDLDRIEDFVDNWQNLLDSLAQ